MAAGKLFLLLVAGGLAGAAFASMTSGVMRPYRDAASEANHRAPLPDSAAAPADGSDLGYAQPPTHQSWLDEGLSLLDSPAWPFDHGAGDDQAPPTYQEGYGPNGYDGYIPRDDRRGYQSPDGYADDGYPDQVYDEGTSPGYGDADPSVRPDPRLETTVPSRQGDAATDAARRAADAAQDVMTAEHDN